MLWLSPIPNQSTETSQTTCSWSTTKRSNRRQSPILNDWSGLRGTVKIQKDEQDRRESLHCLVCLQSDQRDLHRIINQSVYGRVYKKPKTIHGEKGETRQNLFR